MKLKRFRVTQFRSVIDSGWIEADDVTALIGTNESGKTNILLPLWKLNPAKEGAIVPTADFPRKEYNTLRGESKKPTFIRAVFELDEQLATEVEKLTGVPFGETSEVEVSRDLGGQLFVSFSTKAPRAIERAQVIAALDDAGREIEAGAPLKSEESLKQQFLTSLKGARDGLPAQGDFDAAALDGAIATLQAIKLENAPKTSALVPRYTRVVETLSSWKADVQKPHPTASDEARALIASKLPKFVYYSTYGNLDSEIYLPHVIENLARNDLGPREEAKARTLRVLFEFVQLKPKEILELGTEFRDPNDPSRLPTPDEAAAIAEKKKQRSILLQSASTMLTKEFRAWWKQGAYRFRFEADGNHFRIWVSDDKRPEEIELEGRSTGLQWFLSFYLVFLVERATAHNGAILLLDEPGVSLHPLAQRDLSGFFDALASTNPLIYTSHSPFLIDSDRLDRARKVYVDADGSSKATADLGSKGGDASQRGASYTVHAALGLTVAESLLLGCTPVVVEGPSDQHYLTCIKNLLIAAGRLKPGRELVFPPAGGTKGVKAVASILLGRDEAMPVVLLDSDAPGLQMARALRDGMYSSTQDRVLDVAVFTKLPDSEIEDLMPQSVVAQELDRWQRGANTPFADCVTANKPIVPQIETWASAQGVVLQKPGWKVELAKRVKERLLSKRASPIDAATLDLWAKVFVALDPPVPS